MSDAELLWGWANDPETRRNSFSTAPIPYAEHLVWLEGRLRSEATSIWVFSDGPTPVGQVRFDLTGDVAEISIVVAPEHRGRGYGRAVLRGAVRRLREEHGEAVRPRAMVLKGNARSLRLFEVCGFREVGVMENVGEKRAVVLELVGDKEHREGDVAHGGGMAARSGGGERPPERFYQRFDEHGRVRDPRRPRITDEASERDFEPRRGGLRVLFINAPIREWSYPNILPIGHAYVAAAAAMDGHTVDVLDLNAERRGPIKEPMEVFRKWVESRVVEKLERGRPDVIGLGGIITQYGWIKRIAALCKQVHPDVPVILGGGIASSMPEFMVKRMAVDAVVQEEGEVTFSELLNRLEIGASLKGVKGVAYRHWIRPGEWTVLNNGLRPSVQSRDLGLDALPWPLRSRWAEDDVYKLNPVGHLNWQTKWVDGISVMPGQYSVSMIASRGCPYASKACDYCYASYLGKIYRLRSPREVVDEMQFLKERYGVVYIHFLDDLLMTDYHWALELCAELRERKRTTGFEVMWGGTCRTNIVADDVLRARREGRPHMLEQAYEVGMRQAGYGVESASPTILKNIDKSGQKLEKMEIAIRETQRVLGYADCSFMIGSPGENAETVRETVEFCKEVGLRPEVFFFTTAYPGTAFWDLAQEKGLIRKAVTGEKGPADEDIVEEYFLRLGEQGEEVRTNFSDLPDEEIAGLSWWAVTELGAQNTARHPHTGEPQERRRAVRGATRADV